MLVYFQNLPTRLASVVIITKYAISMQPASCKYTKLQIASKLLLICGRYVGKGRVGLGVDRYLLDNRNRTQKWDE